MAELSEREKDYQNKIVEEGKWITEDFLREVISEHENSDRIKIVEKSVEPAVGLGNNYLSSLHRVAVRFCENGSGPKEKHLIVKQFPRALVAQKMLNELGLFTKEMNMYADILPKMEKIQKERTKDPFIASGSYKNKLENVIIMDDLKVQGYRIMERRDLLPLENCLLALKTIARLQVLSLALERERPGTKAGITTDFYSEKNRIHMEPFIHQMFPVLARLFEEHPESARFGKVTRDFAPKGFDILADTFKRATKDFLQVLVHGDMWLTNIMFKDDEKGRPVHAKFVDFQCCRVASPAIDVLHLLFSSAQPKVLSENWNDLIETYYDAFQENLKIFGFPENFFTLEELHSELKRLSPYGFFMACVMLPNVLNNPEDVIDMESIKEDCFEIPDGCGYLKKLFNNEKTRNDIIGTVAELERLGYLEDVQKIIESRK